MPIPSVSERIIEEARTSGAEVLSLAGTDMTSLPSSISAVSNLRWLDLSDNNLTELPEVIGKLSKLRHLFLDRNQLKSLPESLRQLPALAWLYLEGNDLLGLPPEVIGQHTNPGAIFEYYFRVRAGKSALNEAKLILVGRGGVGKTSLVNGLVFSRFDPNETKTEGIRITEWELNLREGERVRLNIWDFGGQEIMHATHQFFLTQRTLYLLVLEGRQGAEDADAEYWLKLIESFGIEASGEVSPVIVVLNKTNGQPFDLNRRALQQKYPFIRSFIATDCADGTGIEDLHAAVKQETDQLKHLRDAFPASWFAIKERLAGIKANFITFERYRELCDQLGEADSAGQDTLAFYLHSLGIALNYKDDPRLRDTHVLNPQWVTGGIYKILNAPILAKQKGELRLADTAAILDSREYPVNMHNFLIDLMRKFELCFTFPNDDSHYLIPELLEKQEPVEAETFRSVECLNFEYRYSVLPEGLLPRFIVRTQSLSVSLPRWRTGVVLEFDGNCALVKADVQDKRVFIAVSGPAAGRRRLLAIIRSDFERIHSDISKLRPEAFVALPGYPGEAVPYEDLLVMEQEDERKFKKAIKGRLVEFKVHDLLNGVDLDRKDQRKPAGARPAHLFYSYSREDEALRDKLEIHLKLLQRTGIISPWHDRKIEAGDDWKERIDEHLERADIILLLVSSDFIASDYCYDVEMKRALERHRAGDARVIPIIVRDVNWKAAPFGKLQALPTDAKAIELWDNRDSAWRHVSEEIERAVVKNWAGV